MNIPKKNYWTAERINSVSEGLTRFVGNPFSEGILAVALANVPSNLHFRELVPPKLSRTFRGSNHVSKFIGQIVWLDEHDRIAIHASGMAQAVKPAPNPREPVTIQSDQPQSSSNKGTFLAACRATISRGATCVDLGRWLQEVKEGRIGVLKVVPTVERRASFRQPPTVKLPTVSLLGFLPNQFKALKNNFRYLKFEIKDEGVGDLTIMTSQYHKDYTYVKNQCARFNKKFIFSNVGGLSMASKAIQDFAESRK